MEILQATNKESQENLNSRLLVFFLNLNLMALIINFSLNFSGSPVLKYQYLIHLAITFAAILLFNFSQILPIILTLFFLEGQGRILWGNAAWTKIIFDMLILLSILKIFIKNKKIFELQVLPKPLITLIALHFIWYLLEFTNPDSISYFAVAAASKVYIYPILYFFGLTQIDFEISQKQFQKSLSFFIFLLILELSLTFFHYYMKEQFILQISPNYQTAMKDFIFTGSMYRPFGTSFYPGAISSYLFLTVGFLFLKKNNMPGKALNVLLICATSFAIILCQVRSAFIKIVLIILIIQIGELIYHRFHPKRFLGIIMAGLILFYGTQLITGSDFAATDEGFENVRDRFTSLGDAQTIKNSRLTMTKFVQIASEKIASRPLGLGPGLTGAVGRLSIDQVRESRFLNVGMLWASDNLMISLLIDFGVGAIFYLLILLYIPIYFFQYLFKSYLSKSFEPFNTVLVCFSSILVVLFGSWGSVGLTYNPESFIFWFFAALGFQTISKYKLT